MRIKKCLECPVCGYSLPEDIKEVVESQIEEYLTTVTCSVCGNVFRVSIDVEFGYWFDAADKEQNIGKKDAAEMLGVSIRQLQRYSASGRINCEFKDGKTTYKRYSIDTLKKYLDEKRQVTA